MIYILVTLRNGSTIKCRTVTTKPFPASHTERFNVFGMVCDEETYSWRNSEIWKIEVMEEDDCQECAEGIAHQCQIDPRQSK